MISENVPEKQQRRLSRRYEDEVLNTTVKNVNIDSGNTDGRQLHLFCNLFLKYLFWTELSVGVLCFIQKGDSVYFSNPLFVLLFFLNNLH